MVLLAKEIHAGISDELWWLAGARLVYSDQPHSNSCDMSKHLKGE